MRQVYALVRQLAATDVTLAFTGETGTGKDVLAHLVHSVSARSRAPFVVFDCGAVPPNLVESELFGHERGSFTGAHADHPGAFERAQGGVLFLDEIGELPLELQPSLLRVLDDHSVRRVGGTGQRRVDVRVIAATNRDLGALVAAKQFRQDLYFRLAAAIVQLPPLRDRLEDLPLLVPRLHEGSRAALTCRCRKRRSMRCAATAGPGTFASSRTSSRARWRSWRRVRWSSRITSGSLRLRPRTPGSTGCSWPATRWSSWNASRSGRRCSRCAATRSHAAKILGIAPSTLYEKVKKYGL